MSNVTTTFTSDDSRIQAALAKLNSEVVKLKEANKKLAAESKKATDESAAGLAKEQQARARVAQAVDGTLGRLRQQLAAQKLSADQVEILKLKTQGASEAQLRAVKGLQAAVAAHKQRAAQASAEEAAAQKQAAELERQKQKQEQIRQAIEGTLAGMRQQVAMLGMTADEAELYRLKLQGATKEQLAQAAGLQRTVAAHKEQTAAAQAAKGEQEQQRQKQEQIRQNVERTLQSLRDQVATQKMTVQQAELYRLKQAGATREQLAQAAALQRQLTPQRGIGALLSSQAAKLAGIAAGYLGVQAIVSKVRQENERFNQSLEGTVTKLIEAQLRLQIQSGQTPAQFEQQLPKLQQVIEQTPVTDLAGGLALQQQAVSSGFEEKDVAEGKVLDVLLQMNAANATFGKAEVNKEDVKGAAAFLKAQGKAADAEGLRSVAIDVTELFAKTSLELADLKSLARQQSVFTNAGLSQETSLSAFSLLKDELGDASTAATGQRQVVSRLQTAGGEKEKVKALKSIGLRPEDVDLVGEDFPTALEKLKAALAGVDKESKSLVLKKVFGEEGMAAANILLGKTDVLRERTAQLGVADEDSAFARGVETFRGHRVAARQRTEIRRQVSELEVDKQRGEVTTEDVMAAIDEAAAAAKARGEGGAGVDVRTAAIKFGIKTGFGSALGDLREEVVGDSGIAFEALKILETDRPELKNFRETGAFGDVDPGESGEFKVNNNPAVGATVREVLRNRRPDAGAFRAPVAPAADDATREMVEIQKRQLEQLERLNRSNAAPPARLQPAVLTPAEGGAGVAELKQIARNTARNPAGAPRKEPAAKQLSRSSR
ncbi:MAG: phage tail tape measure protein [Planctomycetes bacterium]|nr:phage tail tape measure protein [Planctomycetota bacterium]